MDRRVVDVRFRFSPQEHRALAQFADAMYMTSNEVIRDALSAYWWLAREHDAGTRFLARRGQWGVRSIVLWPVVGLLLTVGGLRVTELRLPSLEGLPRLPDTHEDGYLSPPT